MAPSPARTIQPDGARHRRVWRGAERSGNQLISEWLDWFSRDNGERYRVGGGIRDVTYASIDSMAAAACHIAAFEEPAMTTVPRGA